MALMERGDGQVVLDERSRQLAIAIAVLLLLAVLWWWLSTPAQAPAQPSPSPMPNGPNYSYSLNYSSLPVTMQFSESGNPPTISANLTNEGNSTLDSVVVALLPSGSNPSGYLFSQTPPGAGQFILDNPPAYSSQHFIPPGQSALLSVSSKATSLQGTPFFLFPASSPLLYANQSGTSQLLSNLSAYPLDFQSASLFSAFASTAFSSSEDLTPLLPSLASAMAQASSLPQEDEAQVLSAYNYLLLGPSNETLAQRAGDALYYSSLASRAAYLASAGLGNSSVTELLLQMNSGLSSTQLPMWQRLSAAGDLVSAQEASLGVNPFHLIPGSNTTGRNSTNYTPPTYLFPQLPAGINITVNEGQPVGFATISINGSVDTGYPLALFTGDAASMLSFSPTRLGANTTAVVTADLSGQYIPNGQFPFDNLTAQLVLGYGSLPGLQKTVNVTIFVNPHTNLFSQTGQCGIDAGFDGNLTDQQALQAISSMLSCNPLCAISGFPPVGQAVQGAPSGTAAAVAYASTQYIGVLPYVWGGTSLTTGADCSGFVQQLYLKYAGITIPRTSGQQFSFGTPVARNSLLPGDLVFFSNTDPARGNNNGVSHVGIYLGTGVYGPCTFVNEPSTGQDAKYANLCNNYESSHYAGARRIIPSTASPTSTSTTTSTTTTTAFSSSSSSTTSSSTTTTLSPSQVYSQAIGSNGCVQNFGSIVNVVGGPQLPAQTQVNPKSPACLSYLGPVNAVLSTTPLPSHGVGIDFVMALIDQESSCNQNIAGGQGLMQVETCTSSTCNLQQNIQMGVAELQAAYIHVRSQGFTGQALLQLLAFQYNRGIGTENQAAALIGQGIDPVAAMNQACETNPGIQAIAASEGKDLCTPFGYGATYYNAIQQKCVQLYGSQCSTQVD